MDQERQELFKDQGWGAQLRTITGRADNETQVSDVRNMRKARQAFKIKEEMQSTCFNCCFSVAEQRF